MAGHEKQFELVGRDRLQQMVDRGEIAPDLADEAKAWLSPSVGEARINTAESKAVDAAPPRPDLPLTEPATYKADNSANLHPMGTAVPYGAGNQAVAGFNAGPGPKLEVGGREPTPPVASDLNADEANQTKAVLEAPSPAQPQGAGSALAGIDLNAPNVQTSNTTTVGRTIASPEHLRDLKNLEAAKTAEANAHRAIGEAKYQEGQAQAAATKGYADQLVAGNAEYQAKVDSRKAQVDAAMAARDKASQDYQNEAKTAPLGTMLNPTTAQAVTSAIAQALGAFGSTLAHGQNAALALLNQQLDSAQKERATRLQGKAFGVRMADRHLEDLREIFRDDDAAHLAWKADIKEQAATKALQLAQQYGGEEAKLNGEQFAQATMASAAQDLAQAHATLDKHVQSSTTTQVQSGPDLAIKRAEALMKAQNGNDLPVNWDNYKNWVNKDLARRDLITAGVQNIPSAIQRVSAVYGADVKSWGKAAAAGFDGVNLTPAQKDALSGMYRLLNAEIYDSTGKAMNENEAGRIKVALGFSDFSKPSDIMRSLQMVGRKLNVDRASMIQANHKYASVFDAYDQNSSSPARPSGNFPGSIPGQ